MRWVPLSDMVGHANEPRQFFDAEGELFIYGVKREGGPDDAYMPRRIVGMGRSTGAAYADAVKNIRAYDPTYQVNPSS